MGDDLKWAIGAALPLMAGAFWWMLNRISSATKALHDRIDEVKDVYVRRDDLNGHITRLEKNVDDVREEIRRSRQETNTRLDALIAAMSKPQ